MIPKKTNKDKTKKTTEAFSGVKIPPQDIDAEKSVLGALMIDKNAINKVADLLTPEDFYKDHHNIIYSAMIELYLKREPIDMVSVPSKLKETNALENIGGRAYLASLANSVPTASNIIHYSKIVKQKSVLRGLIEKSYEISLLGYQENSDIELLLDEAEQKIFSITQSSLTLEFTPVASLLQSAHEKIELLQKNPNALRGTATGFKNLDRILAGLQKADLVILAARPSIGKTSLALDIARNIAIKEKLPVGIFSLEMPKEQLVDRLISAEARVDLQSIRTGRYNAETMTEDQEFIAEAIERLSKAPIFIDDNSSINVIQMKAAARRLESENGLGLIVVDYLQLMQPRNNNNDNMVQQITEISRSLKNLARELNVPVLALAQLSRAIEHRQGQIPRLSDLRESGSIEQDADVVMFIHRKDIIKEKEGKMVDENEKNIAEVIIAKHRNGPIGKAELYFKNDCVSFLDLDRNIENI